MRTLLFERATIATYVQVEFGKEGIGGRWKKRRVVSWMRLSKVCPKASPGVGERKKKRDEGEMRVTRTGRRGVGVPFCKVWFCCLEGRDRNKERRMAGGQWTWARERREQMNWHRRTHSIPRQPAPRSANPSRPAVGPSIILTPPFQPPISRQSSPSHILISPHLVH